MNYQKVMNAVVASFAIALCSCAGGSQAITSSSDFSSSSSSSSVSQKVYITVINGKGSGKYYIGDSCTVTATIPEGKRFVDWEDEEGNSLSKDASYTFIVSKAITLIATLTDADYSVDFEYIDRYSSSKNEQDGGSWCGYSSTLSKDTHKGSDSSVSKKMTIGATSNADNSPKGTSSLTWDGISEVTILFGTEFASIDVSKDSLSFDVLFSNMGKGLALYFGDASGKTFLSTYFDVASSQTDSNMNVSKDGDWYHYFVDLNNFASSINLTSLTKFGLLWKNGTKGDTTIDHTKEHSSYLDNVAFLPKEEAVKVSLSGGAFNDGTTEKSGLIGERYLISASSIFTDMPFGGWVDDGGNIIVDESEDYYTFEKAISLRATFAESDDHSSNAWCQNLLRGDEDYDGAEPEEVGPGHNKVHVESESSKETFYSIHDYSCMVDPYETADTKTEFHIWAASYWPLDWTKNILMADFKIGNMAPACFFNVWNGSKHWISPTFGYDGKDIEGGNVSLGASCISFTKQDNDWVHVEFDPLACFGDGVIGNEREALLEQMAKIDTIRIGFTTGGISGSSTHAGGDKYNDWDTTKEVSVLVDNFFAKEKK